MSPKKMTMGVIIGDRGFFPDHLAKTGREEMMRALATAGMDCVVLGSGESKHGAVETDEEAKRCAALFPKNRDRIDAVIVSLPNFGGERPSTPSGRFSTDDTVGAMRGYVGEGAFTDDPLNTFGGAGVVEIPHLQELLRYICENGPIIFGRRCFFHRHAR